MKISRKINGLYRSTKTTMVVCAILLIITATALFLLMLFPIQPKEPEVIVLNRHSPVQLQKAVQETEEPSEEPTETEPVVQPAETVHTLSTWSANISGFKQDFAGFNKQELGITTADPFPLRTKATTTTKKPEETQAPKVEVRQTQSPKPEISVVNQNEARQPAQTVTQAVPEQDDSALAPPPMPDVAE